MTLQEVGIAAPEGMTPALPHIFLDPAGRHALLGSRCSACEAVVEGERLACPACGARDTLQPMRFAATGRVHAHTVVHRSFPGVPTPFIAVVVDMDGGGVLRGTLLDVVPDAMPAEQRVALVFRDTGQRDAQDRAFISYYFVPQGDAGQ